MVKELLKNKIHQNLFYDPGFDVYAVLDGASIDGLPQELWEYEPEHCCLYRGEIEPDMAEVAPYLVKLDPDSDFTDKVISQGWGNHWGIYVKVPAGLGLGVLRRHFRGFLMVIDDVGNHVYFRYYDPRVLNLYLPTCVAEELDVVFGPVLNFLAEDSKKNLLINYWVNEGELQTEEIVVMTEV